MRTYLGIFKIRFISTIHYRTAALAGIMTQFAWGSLLILMFKTLYKHNSSAFPMTMKELSDYIWIQQALLNLFAIWIYDNSIFEDIISGQVAYQFARPIDLYNNWFANNLAMRLARTLLRCFLLFIIPFLFQNLMGSIFLKNQFYFL
ncbi:hypothetical protein N1496_04540 [Streptococcus didelphis]|uniref:Uncharacterized protein n=1 Tax=Streptococcus didelphis TaxID=102886 RepID=A0ABY9LIR9_9STRE|nr:hypothetical protein [Streptococcus didelphis]WMB28731.1 hypothetical protein N1496_04540 [Streptococcus didelphis]